MTFIGPQVRRLPIALALVNLLFVLCPAVVAYGQAAGNEKPRITGVQILNFSSKDKTANLTIEIIGEKIGGATAVSFNTLGGQSITAKIESTAENRVVVSATAPVPTEINRIILTVGGKAVEAEDFKLSIAEEKKQPQAVQEIEIKFEQFKSPTYPNHFTLMVTRQDGAGKFVSDPNQMHVEILPPGASDVRIRSGSNSDQLLIDFLAPEKFEVKGVVVTVYDRGGLDNRTMIAIAKPFKEKPAKADPNQPTISSTEILFLQRSKGTGRLKIEGSGFGQYAAPPISGDDFLRKCIRRTNITPIEADPFSVDCSAENVRLWRAMIDDRINLVVVPRNTDLRVGRTEILSIDDKMIDVYFEFSSVDGYSRPFRPLRTSLTIRKPGLKTVQTIKEGGSIATVSGPETYLATKEIGPKRDDTLQYRFQILDNESAKSLFGPGVAANFYVIQLAIVNTGTKKVAIPLSAIQAEIDWAHGGSGSNSTQAGNGTEYLEGPPTISPIPLAAVSGYFDAYNKVKGVKAKFFNWLDAVATLGAAVVLQDKWVGPGWKDGHVVFTGGVIPALRRGLGDLSSQQLQNLTGLSWESVEEVPPSGGSVNKFIYLPRGEQLYTISVGLGQPNVRKGIKNLLGLEVTGFEVIEAEPKQATQP
ncbi:MAG TPA: hypothetical protein VKA70_06140 [Blastocatellia bacterium]|nr:hypothetical protein [Blastocatellia bacterium]